MNIIDFIVILVILFGAYRGWRYGMFTSILTLVGTIVLVIIGYYLKNPVSELMYTVFPFRNYGGIFNGVSSFNILVYEAFAYVLVLFILAIIFKSILKVTGILDKFVKMTMVFALPSKLIGLIFGGLQWFIYSFLIIFICAQIPFTADYVNSSKVAKPIFKNTPLLSNITNNMYHAVTEVMEVCDLHKEMYDERELADYETLDVLLKYDIISPSSARKLIKKNKLTVVDSETLFNKYEGKTNKVKDAADKIYNEAQKKLDEVKNNND